MATISHELRTPLHAIMGYANLMLEGTYGPAPTQPGGPLERILAGSSNLLAIIDSILDYSKLSAGMEKVLVGDFDAALLLQEVAASLAAQAEKKGLALQVRAEGRMAMRADKAKIGQVLSILAGNAVKFAEKGMITLTAQASAGLVAFSVADAGPGIAPDHLEHIFARFTQADNSISRRHGGTGLGLAIAKKLCELLGGSIGVESLVGSGSTFWASFPAQPPAASPAAGAEKEGELARA
jgi:signal transduction histidine kinase